MKRLRVVLPAQPRALFAQPGADFEGFLVVQWAGRTGNYSVHASDLQEAQPPVLH